MANARFACVAALAILASRPILGVGPVPPAAVGMVAAPEVQAVGVYEGAYPNGVAHAPKFHPPGAVTVRVGAVKRPLVLVLMAYEPVVWTVDDPAGVVVRVIASGYYRQTVNGLGAKVPVTSLSEEANDKGAFYVWELAPREGAPVRERAETRRRLRELVRRVNELTGLGVAWFHAAYAAVEFTLS